MSRARRAAMLVAAVVGACSRPETRTQATRAAPDAPRAPSATTTATPAPTTVAPPAQAWPTLLERGLQDLARVPAPFPADVIVSLRAVASLTGDSEPALLAERRKVDLDVDDRRYAPLLEGAKPPWPEGRIDRALESATSPDPSMVSPRHATGETLVGHCVERAIRCALPTECREFVGARDRWGYVLTHQAVWLAIWRWQGCPERGVGTDALRNMLAANLAKEAAADPAFSDLAAERLAMLGHLGFARDVPEAAWRAVATAQRPEGCWPSRAGAACDPHTTGLALWALAHAHRARSPAVAAP